ncbi:MAG: lysophospholipid acyltransferase family protein [Thiohalomonadales bacterium]
MLHLILKFIWLTYCWFEVAIFTVILYSLSWYPKVLKQHQYHNLTRIWCRLLVRALNVDLRLHQKNKRDLPKHYILVANHPSAFEDFGIPALFNTYPLAKEGVRDWFFIGKLSVAAGTIFVKRSDPDSRQQVIEELMNKITAGYNISMFPEGGCYGRRIGEKFHTGAFELSIKTGVPIVPVFLHYEEQETFEWHDPDTLLHKFWHFMTSQNNHANYYVFDAISPEGFTEKSDFAEHVRIQYLRWQEKYLD